MDVAIASRQERLVVKSLTINRPTMRVYQAWRDLAGRHSAHVWHSQRFSATSPSRTITVPSIGVMGAASTSMAELTLDIPGTLIAWKSLSSSSMRQSGEVWFSPLPHDHAEVRLLLSWHSGDDPWGQLATSSAGPTAALLERELVHFKRFIEG